MMTKCSFLGELMKIVRNAGLVKNIYTNKKSNLELKAFAKCINVNVYQNGPSTKKSVLIQNIILIKLGMHQYENFSQYR